MFFERVYEKGLAQASYIVGCQETKEAIVIDPKRDVDTYLQIAQREKLNITHITETHIHADFLSGARELAAATGAEIYLSDEGGDDWQYQFEHKGLKDGSRIKVGNVMLEAIHTPGHTPEHLSFLLTDTAASNRPSMIFTGDFVFVGDVGRPDLLEKAAGIEGTMIESAKNLFQSLKRFKTLPDYVQIWPGHGAGSACGKALGSVPNSTIGYEKFSNWALKINDENNFVEVLLEGQPEPPKYFAEMKKLNKTGPKILNSLRYPKKISIDELKKAIDKGFTIVDTRNKIKFANGHIPGSLNIQDNNSFSTWAGWILDYQNPIVLITSEERVDSLTRSLIRIGMDNLSGYFDEYDKIEKNGVKLQTLNIIDADRLNEQIDKYKIIDVRSYTEFNNSRIPGAVNIHTGYIGKNLDKINKNENILLYCESGDRSGIAASLLSRLGYKNIYNLNGGIDNWIKLGYSLEERRPGN
jgi:hydroxyacylglutathione hydrolase